MLWWIYISLLLDNKLMFINEFQQLNELRAKKIQLKFQGFEIEFKNQLKIKVSSQKKNKSQVGNCMIWHHNAISTYAILNE